jgi:hypothetical protein
MIQSRFIADILDLLLDGDEDGVALRSQIPFLTDSDYEYTGSGLFVSFSHSESISQFKLISNTAVTHGVEIKSSELELGADTTLFISEGMVSTLEIFAYDGNYPEKELTDYVLTQIWNGSLQRQISR